MEPWAGARKRGRFAALATPVAIAAAACCLLATANASAAPIYRGVQLHSLWPGANAKRDLDMARASGANLVRVDVGWGSLQMADGDRFTSWYRTRLDRFMAGAAARRMKVLATLWGTPCWASSAPWNLRRRCRGKWDSVVAAYPPADPADYARIAHWMTARYGSKLAALEIWNEPDLPVAGFWSGDADAYARLLRAGYSGAKSGNASVPVITAGLAGTNPRYLTQLYTSGIRGYYDGIGVHPYADPGFKKLRGFRATQVLAGDSAPLWLTEFGWPTGAASQWHVSEKQQASSIRGAFRDLVRLGFVQGASLYNLRDTGSNRYSMTQNFGLVRFNYRAKPSFAAFRVALRGR